MTVEDTTINQPHRGIEWTSKKYNIYKIEWKMYWSISSIILEALKIILVLYIFVLGTMYSLYYIIDSSKVNELVWSNYISQILLTIIYGIIYEYILSRRVLVRSGEDE